MASISVLPATASAAAAIGKNRWWVVSPGLLIVITAVTFMLLALAMEPIVNPRLRRDTSKLTRER